MYPFGPDILSYCILNQTCLFVCFKGGIGTGACPGSPLCLTNMSVFAEDLQSREFPLHHYGAQRSEGHF